MGLQAKKDCCREENPCTGNNPSKFARSWQGKGVYKGKDSYKNVIVKKGTILYTLYPHGNGTPNYFVDASQVMKTKGQGARAYNDAIQVSHSGNTKGAYPMRTQLHKFIVTKDMCMAFGEALKNPKLGGGGGTQYVV